MDEVQHSHQRLAACDGRAERPIHQGVSRSKAAGVPQRREIHAGMFEL